MKTIIKLSVAFALLSLVKEGSFQLDHTCLKKVASAFCLNFDKSLLYSCRKEVILTISGNNVCDQAKRCATLKLSCMKTTTPEPVEEIQEVPKITTPELVEDIQEVPKISTPTFQKVPKITTLTFQENPEKIEVTTATVENEPERGPTYSETTCEPEAVETFTTSNEVIIYNLILINYLI